ncbi:hypothetical protein [Bartonella phoceensis]|uniref:hypothetical protein n=1 Tax=Bartonella phoceensis TaxID=270249 RepID=UPI001FE9B46B|nr:hypothetical protein [Bartonella phoceensis]
MSDKEFQLFSFKKAMLFSRKDYVMIFCISFIVLAVSAAIIYIKPLEFFHVISKEQLQEINQKRLQGAFLENLKDFVFGQISLGGVHVEKLWRAAGWNGVKALICFLPQVIFGISQMLFPVILIFHFLLDFDLKEMLQQLEKLPE